MFLKAFEIWLSPHMKERDSWSSLNTKYKVFSDLNIFVFPIFMLELNPLYNSARLWSLLGDV
jgi:hypothetical protein